MTKSLSRAGWIDSLSGGALHVLAAIGERFLSKCINIFAMIPGSIMQAIILTLLLSHTSQIVMSILNTLFKLCGRDRVYLNLSDVLLNEGCSYHVVRP